MTTEDTGQCVSVGQLAKLLLITETRIQQLAKQGVIVKGGRGEYRLVPSIHGYIKFLQKDSRTGGDDGTDAGDYGKHRARLYKARADKAEVEASLVKGTSHDAGAVAKVWADMIGNTRAKLLAVPTKLAAMMEGMTIAQRQEALATAMSEALRELADYSPEVVTGEYVKNRRADHDEEEDDASE